MIKTVTLKIDTEKFRDFIQKTGGREDFTGIVGLAYYDEQVTKDLSGHGFHDNNGIEVVSVEIQEC